MSNEKENLSDSGSGTFLEHLKELRYRILICVGLMLLAFFVCFYFAEKIFNLLVQPLLEARDSKSQTLIYTALHEKFVSEIKIALYTAFVLTFPITLSQIWFFIAPGLYRKEKHFFLPFLVMTPVLFFAGMAFVYYVLMPIAWQFFLSFEQTNNTSQATIQLLPKVNEYLSLVMSLMLAFGLCFQLPVALNLLVLVRILSVKKLKKYRKYGIVLAFVAAAILTPPDPLSQFALALPIILLYEASILVAILIERSRQNKKLDDSSTQMQNPL